MDGTIQRFTLSQTHIKLGNTQKNSEKKKCVPWSDHHTPRWSSSNSKLNSLKSVLHTAAQLTLLLDRVVAEYENWNQWLQLLGSHAIHNCSLRTDTVLLTWTLLIMSSNQLDFHSLVFSCWATLDFWYFLPWRPAQVSYQLWGRVFHAMLINPCYYYGLH